MPIPTYDPADQLPGELVGGAGIWRVWCPGDRVWLHVAGAWQPGVVLASTDRAATVRYRLPGRGTATDTVLPGPHLAERTDPDPHLDAVDDARALAARYPNASSVRQIEQALAAVMADDRGVEELVDVGLPATPTRDEERTA